MSALPCSLWYYLHVSRYGNSISAINGRMNNEDVPHARMCAHTHTNIQKYYAAMRKKEIVPFEPVQVDPEGIMLNDTASQRKAHAAWGHLHVESKTKSNSLK